MKTKLIFITVFLLFFCSSFKDSNNEIIYERFTKILELIQSDSLTAETLCEGKFNALSFVIDTSSSCGSFLLFHRDSTIIKFLADSNEISMNINTKMKRYDWLKKFDENREREYKPVFIESRCIYGKEKGNIYCKIVYDIIKEKIFYIMMDRIFPPQGYYRGMIYVVIFNDDSSIKYFKSIDVKE
ncbi:MAG: hypothetical protein WCT77_11215 [Bacteroidota bacterium]